MAEPMQTFALMIFAGFYEISVLRNEFVRVTISFAARML